MTSPLLGALSVIWLTQAHFKITTAIWAVLTNRIDI
jgi:hypothetical protein